MDEQRSGGMPPDDPKGSGPQGYGTSSDASDLSSADQPAPNRPSSASEPEADDDIEELEDPHHPQ